MKTNASYYEIKVIIDDEGEVHVDGEAVIAVATAFILAVMDQVYGTGEQKIPDIEKLLVLDPDYGVISWSESFSQIIGDPPAGSVRIDFHACQEEDLKVARPYLLSAPKEEKSLLRFWIEMTIADLVCNSIKALIDGGAYNSEFDLMAQLLDFCRVWDIEIPLDEGTEAVFRGIIKKAQATI